MFLFCRLFVLLFRFVDSDLFRNFSDLLLIFLKIVGTSHLKPRPFCLSSIRFFDFLPVFLPFSIFFYCSFVLVRFDRQLLIFFDFNRDFSEISSQVKLRPLSTTLFFDWLVDFFSFDCRWQVYTEEATWDCVATCFFIDCANNIVAFIETIYKILKPGNRPLGPAFYRVFTGFQRAILALTGSYRVLLGCTEFYWV